MFQKLAISLADHNFLVLAYACTLAVDDLREESCVEKNADRTLYTFKKPARGKAFSRTAPLIRVPVNKYANPRNRKIEDVRY